MRYEKKAYFLQQNMKVLVYAILLLIGWLIYVFMDRHLIEIYIVFQNVIFSLCNTRVATCPMKLLERHLFICEMSVCNKSAIVRLTFQGQKVTRKFLSNVSVNSHNAPLTNCGVSRYHGKRNFLDLFKKVSKNLLIRSMQSCDFAGTLSSDCFWTPTFHNVSTLTSA